MVQGPAGPPEAAGLPLGLGGFDRLTHRIARMDFFGERRNGGRARRAVLVSGGSGRHRRLAGSPVHDRTASRETSWYARISNMASGDTKQTSPSARRARLRVTRALKPGKPVSQSVRPQAN